MMLLAVSDDVWKTAIEGLFKLAAAGLAAYMTYLLAKLRSNTKETLEVAKTAAKKTDEVAEAAKGAAIEVRQVKDTLETSTASVDVKLDGLAKGNKEIHTLVNSNMFAQLKISAVALRRVAGLTQHPDDEAAAGLAEKELHAHEMKQASVDAAAKT